MLMMQPVVHKPTLLLVDDKEENLISLEALLDDGERVLLRARSGPEALELLLKHEVALVLLDVQMPDMDGYEVARLMRGRSSTRDIPILFITAIHRDPRSVLRGYESGAIDYLFKPINAEILRRKVAVLQELQQGRQKLNAMNRNLDAARAYYAAILSAAAEGILVVDEQGVIRYANPAACQLLQYSEGEIQDQPLQTLAAAPDSNVVPWDNSIFFSHWRRRDVYRALDAALFARDGGRVPVTLSSAPLPEPHRGLVVVFLDNTVPKKLQEQLQRQAITDSLTGLLNREGFLRALQVALARVHRSGKLLAVLFLDLNGFKRINDTLGHQVGDQLLCGVADRLRQCMRPYDVLARLGGDEFTAIVDSVETVDDVAKIAEKVIDALATPQELGGMRIAVGGSIGIASFPECADTVDGLVQAADMAMYQAKLEGRNSYRFFTAEMNGRARVRLMLEESLRDAVEQRTLEVYYQPQIRVKDHALRGFEALLRWNRPDSGPIAPAVFVPLLEEAGLIGQVGAWTLGLACEVRRSWSHLPDFTKISVNLSPRQLDQPGLVDEIAAILARTGLPASQLELEVTEGSLMTNVDRARQTLSALRSLGVRIAVDDFGVGYSSLAYLKQFDLDALKIDRTFVANCLNSEKDAAIIRSIIQLGHNLGVEIVAEGVETVEQLEWLEFYECDTVQGFVFARPLSPEVAAQYAMPSD